jgi:hypothetical protein
MKEIEMPGPTTSGVRIPQSVWDLARFWMNEDLSSEEATAMAILGARSEQREADAKIAEMNGSPEIAAAIRGDKCQLARGR